MSKSHLHALERGLAQKGWRIIAVHPGDGFGVSATWEIQRSTRQPSLFLDFDGLEPMGRYCFPLEESYGCQLRAPGLVYLHFRRVNSQKERWDQELSDFINALDSVSLGDLAAQPADAPDTSD